MLIRDGKGQKKNFKDYIYAMKQILYKKKTQNQSDAESTNPP